MHRELTHADDVFAPPGHLALYAFTGLLVALLGLDLWPFAAAWIGRQGLDAPTWANEWAGYRVYALAAAVLGGARVLFTSLERLADGKVGADLAVAVAAFAALAPPVRDPLIAAEVVVIALVGECLEAWTFDRARRAVGRLVELFPRRCWRLAADGTEERVLTTELRVGDRVVVKPGAKVPCDGTVTDGRSAVDASALTGESVPLDKAPGDAVLAGSVNQFGSLTVAATRVSEQTVAGRVLELTARALKAKAPAERIADRMARWFLPVVLALAAVTLAGHLLAALGPWRLPADRPTFGVALRQAIYPALAVLVVACPCALILATPTAVVAALGRLAGTGVLLKSGAALERLAGVTAFAFDKTGTLTEGRLTVGDVVPFGDFSADDVLRLAASAEQGSEHPLARAVLAAARGRGLAVEPADEFVARPGVGVLARCGGRLVFVGSRRLVEETTALPAEALAALARLEEGGQTPLVLAVDGHVRGVVGCRDTPRAGAGLVLNELRALGITDIQLLTGDRAGVAGPLAAELGITDVHAELLPQQKAERVAGRAVAMVGDGVNDAPALASASVGLAVGGGAELAAEAGDVILMGDPLQPLPLLVALSRETARVIRQNVVVFAVGVNVVGVVLTAWVMPLVSPGWAESSPLAAVLYHQAGSLAVLLNSMRLLAFGRTATSPTLTAWRHWWQRTDAGVGPWLDADAWLHAAGHHWRAVTAGVAGLALLAWAASGLVAVNHDEVAVVRRFGRPTDADLGPGLHWRWPWPVERVDRVQPDRVRVVEVGFRGGRPAALTWSSGHQGDGSRRVPDESAMVTGDGSLVEVLASVRYRVSDPRQYLLGAADAEGLLRSAAESALREGAAGEPFLELLTAGRPGFERRAEARLRARLAGLESAGAGLGVAVDGLSLQDLHPPAEVVAEFHAVARAAEAADRRVNDARAEQARKVNAAGADAVQAERQAEAGAKRTAGEAAVKRDRVLAWLAVRRTLPAPEAAALAAGLVGAAGDPLAASGAYRAGHAACLAEHRALTDFRLGWEAIGPALAGRDKVVIDADTLPGRRQLLLFDPELFRPAPFVPRPPREEP